MVDEGYAATQILTQLHDAILEQDLGDKQKSAIAEKMAVSCLFVCLSLYSLSKSFGFLVLISYFEPLGAHVKRVYFQKSGVWPFPHKSSDVPITTWLQLISAYRFIGNT